MDTVSSAAPADIKHEIERRRTFAIISHPDAGKTTLTEKLLLYGGAVNMAGVVRARRNQNSAASDFMEIEKQRGISVSSTVLSFEYDGHLVNLLDTPGHQDFSEDTYRTLLAVDCVVMVLDAAKGIETQTLKLFDVCKQRRLPLFTFINKMDRPSLEPLELMGEIERVLGVNTVPVNWPLGSGDFFRGVYELKSGRLHLFERKGHGSKKAEDKIVDPHSEEVASLLPPDVFKSFSEEIELLSMAGTEFDYEAFLRGEISPVFFGSALTNFGVQLFLDEFLRLAPPPRPRQSDEGMVAPETPGMSGFIFKIQADMNPRHRDRVAFMRVCSGRFERGMKVHCVRTGEIIRLSYPQRLFAQDRETVDEAFPGDVVGLVNSGELVLGDTLVEDKDVHYEPIPLFPPEHFARVIVDDPSRRKQFNKALDQLQREGAIQIFWAPEDSSHMPIMGAVGKLQFEVVEHRLKTDYGVEARFEPMSFHLARWVVGEDADIERFEPSRLAMKVRDPEERLVILVPSEWDLNYTVEKNPKLKFLSVSPR
ncbi:MAG: peptide chain release factor 3 [bacterium]|nr:peptide chain release factor 3 [bacterium]